jgi:hypothetical protein
MGELHEADIEGAELFTTTSPPIDAPAGVHGQVVVRVRDAFLSALMSLGARKWEHHWPVGAASAAALELVACIVSPPSPPPAATSFMNAPRGQVSSKENTRLYFDVVVWFGMIDLVA